MLSKLRREPQVPHRNDDLVRQLEKLGIAADALVSENREAQQQFVWAQQNRHGLLRIHAWGGITIGVAMLFYGTASSFETVLGLWSRWALGGAGILGGLLVAWGLSRTPRHIRTEGAGMSILALWDLGIMASFAVTLWTNPPTLVMPWEPLPADASRVYPIFVYGTLFALLALHVWTLKALITMRKAV